MKTIKVGSREKITPDTTKRVLKIWKKILKNVPAAYKNIQLAFVFTEAGTYKTYQGGYAVEATITLGSQYVNTYNYDVGIAELLSHELAHHILGHMHMDAGKDAGSMVPLGEQDADHLGMFLCELAGFKRQDYIDHFNRFETGPFRNKKLSKRHVDEHGTGSERVERLKAHDIYMNNLEAW